MAKNKHNKRILGGYQGYKIVRYPHNGLDYAFDYVVSSPEKGVVARAHSLEDAKGAIRNMTGRK